jgi:hypothetical protein
MCGYRAGLPDHFGRCNEAPLDVQGCKDVYRARCSLVLIAGALPRWQLSTAVPLCAPDHDPALTTQLLFPQLAKHYGIKTINVVRNDHHVQELKDLG